MSGHSGWAAIFPAMMVYVSFDGDGIGQKVGRASLADDVEAIRRIGQSIDIGNEIWKSWALNNGGSVIECGGDEGRLEIPADKLGDLPTIREQYAQAVDATVTVGVGMKVSEADKALLWGKLNGKDRISFYEPTMEAQLEEALKSLAARPESEKIASEYLAKGDSPQPQSAASGHSAPGVFRNDVHSGMAYRKQPKAARAPGDNPKPEKEHVPAAEHTHAASDYERHFRSLAHDQRDSDDQAKSAAGQPDQDDIKAQVVDVLQKVKEAAPTLDAIKTQAPEVYEAVRDCVQAMIDMAKQMTAPQSLAKHEVDRSCPRCHSPKVLGRGSKRLFCPDCKHSGPAAEFGEDMSKAGLPMPKNSPAKVPQPPVGSEDDGKLKVQHSDGATGWVAVRAGMTLSQDGHAISSRKPNGK